MPTDFAQRYPRLAEMIGIDLRSLALLRVLLGLALLLNVGQALLHAELFYGDAGLLPRADLLAQGSSSGRLDLYLLGGQPLFVLAMLLLQLGAALLLALGLRSGLASALSFLLWVSLLNRNPLIVTPGDLLLAALLFWLIWLPSGARYSMDAALSRTPPPGDSLLVSWASLGLLLQIASLFWFAALLQSGRAWFGEFSALRDLFMLDRLALAPARGLLKFPGLLSLLSGLLHGLLLLSPVLLFLPYWLRPLRLLGIVLLGLLQIGAIFCLALGNLPWVALLSLSALLGGWLWEARRPAATRAALRLYYDGDCEFCRKSVKVLREFLILPQLELARAQDSARTRTLMEANNSWVLIDIDEQAHLKWQVLAALCRHSPLWRPLAPLLRASRVQRWGDALYDLVARQRPLLSRLSAPLLQEREIRWQASGKTLTLVGVLAALCLIWNLQTAGLLPRLLQAPLAPLLKPLQLDQHWDLFAPNPSREDGWWVIDAQRGDGSELDLRHPERSAPDYSKPARIVDESGNQRWRALDARMAESQGAAARQLYARYLCQRANAGRSGRQRIMTLKLIYMLERTPPPGEKTQLEQQVMLRWECFPEETKGQLP